MGGTLASIESQAEQDTLFGLIGAADTWIGAAGTAADKESWKWSDSATWSYTNWENANGPRTKKDKDCGIMKSGKGKWKNVTCYKMAPYACQTTATSL